MRIHWAAVLLFACAHAGGATRDDPLAAAAAACAGATREHAEACIEAALAPSPEQLAKMELARRTHSAYYRRVAERLAASGQPRELAFAATLAGIAAWSPELIERSPPPDPEKGTWRQRALEAAGNDVLALTLLANTAGGERGPVGVAAIARWQALEPDNLAPLLAGQVGAERVLQPAIPLARYDNYFYPRVRWITEMLVRHPPTADELRVMLDAPPGAPGPQNWDEAVAISAIGIDMAVAMPGFQVFESCRGDALRLDGRRDQCRRLAQLLSDASDSVAMENIGIGLLLRTAQTPAERASAEERRQQMDWRIYQFVTLERRLGPTEFIRLLRDPGVPNERELSRRLFAAHGVSFDPPPGWRRPPQPWIP